MKVTSFWKKIKKPIAGCANLLIFNLFRRFNFGKVINGIFLVIASIGVKPIYQFQEGVTIMRGGVVVG